MNLEMEPWEYFGVLEGIPSDGWKVHISLTPQELKRHREEIFRFLSDQKVYWKVPKTSEMHLMLTEPFVAGSSFGKVLTIYLQGKEQEEEVVSFFRTFSGLGNGCRVASCHDERWPWIGSRFGSIKTRYTEDACGKPVRVLESGDEDVQSKLHQGAGELNILAPCKTPVRGLVDLSQFQFITPLSGLDTGPYRALNVSERRFQLLKFGSRGVALTDSDSESDSLSRLKNESQILDRVHRQTGKRPPQLTELSDRISMMTVDLVDGEVLHFIDPIELPRIALEITTALAEVHQLAIGHGDVKPSNILFQRSRKQKRRLRPKFACLIDFETSGPLESRPDRTYTTFGFTRSTDSEGYVERDLFGLGMTLLCWGLGYEPGATSLTLTEFISEALTEVRPLLEARFYQVIRKLVDSTDSYESMEQVRNELESLVKGLDDFGAISVALERNLALHQDEAGMWSGESLFPWAQLRGINIGSAGIHLALESLDLTDSLKSIHSLGLEKLKSLPMSDLAFGLFTGNMGVVQCLEHCGHSHGLSASSLSRFIEETDNPDLFSGLSGILLSLLAMERRGSSEFSELLVPCVERLLSTLLTHEKVIGSLGGESSEFPDSVMLGASHGSLGIALAIYEYSRHVSDSEMEALARKIVQQCAEVSLQKGYLPKRSHDGKLMGLTSSTAWCHGDLGLLWTLAHMKFKEDWEVPTVNTLVERLSTRRVVSNPSICHGMAGVVDVLNRLMRKEEKELNFSQIAKARAWYSRKLQLARTSNERLIWNCDRRGKYSADLMVGFMGSALVSELTRRNEFKSYFEELNLVGECE